MKDLGWISIHRQLKGHWIWEDPIKLKWWLDILRSVNTTSVKMNIGNDLIECKRGQSIKSLQTWAAEWRTSKDKVRNFFKLLEKDKMITLENIKISTRLTVCKYDSYQSKPNANQTTGQRQPNATQTQTHPNNNDNNGDNDNNEITPISTTPAGADKYLGFLEFFNATTGRKFQTLDTKAKQQIDKLKKTGYKFDQFQSALKNGFEDSKSWPKPNLFTPEYFTRESNFVKYLNWELPPGSNGAPKKQMVY